MMLQALLRAMTFFLITTFKPGIDDQTQPAPPKQPPNPKFYTPTPRPYTLCPIPHASNPKPYNPDLTPQSYSTRPIHLFNNKIILSPKVERQPQTPTLKPQTPNPKP